MTDPSGAPTGPTPLPGAAVGFPVTLNEAARHLGMTPETVVDMVRVGLLGAYVAAAHETTERPPLRFDPEALDTFAATLRHPEDGTSPELRLVSETHAIASSLRAYLTERAPADTEHVAMKEDRPLLCHGRRAEEIYAHVREEPIRLRARNMVTGPALVRLAMPKTVTDTLTRLGCQQVRGIRPVGQTKKSWKTWWRVPRSLWSLDAEDLLRVDDIPALGGIPEDDEILEDS